MWLSGLNKQLAVQITHVNGTENENQDLQSNWQQGGYTPPAEGTISVFGLQCLLHISFMILKTQC